MKIVQLCPYDMARPGGVQRHVRDLSAWLAAQGHETRIIAPPAPGQRANRQANLIEAGRSRELALHGTAFELSLAGPSRIRRLRRELRGWGADLVHMHTPWTPMLVWQVWRGLRLPTVTTIHATLPSLDGTSLIDRYIRRAARHFLTHSQACVVPSAAPLPLLRQLLPQVNAQVLPPAIDLSDWRASRVARPAAGGTVSMAFLGRLEARKGVDVLLDAWQRLAPRHPGLHLSIGGDGALRDRVLAAVAADASGRLRYVGRPDDAAARALVAGADLFVAPAPYGESFGIVLAEAMAAGAVPIAAANAGYASVLSGPGADLLVAPGDAAALAAKIEQLATGAVRRNKLRDWGMDHAEQFDVAQAGPKYLRLFQGLSGERNLV